MLVRRYEMPWRRAYEVYAAAVWASALLFFAVTGGLGLLPRQLALPLAAFCLAMGVLRLAQGIHTLVLRASLSGRGIQVLSTRAVARWTEKPDAVFLGFGFEWRPVHSQRLYELAKVDYREFTVSPRLLQVLGYDARPQPDAEIGLPYIHGVEPREVPLHRPLQNFEGGTLLVGTTQSGKGVALANLVTQAVRRGDVVIVIDPKNSRRLKRVTQRACEDWREPDTFLEFHPAFPEAGVRLDFTFNWQKPTEIASRIQSIMPPDTAGAFSAFGWDAVNVVVQGLVELEERPNLVKLTKYIEGGIEPVLEATLRRFYERLLGASWRDQALLASLPMTLSEAFHKDLAKMRRVSRKTMANAIHLAPLIAEWRGTRTPALVFGGRRGQLMTLDIFDNDLGNYNFAIIGAPGSGKSVLMNEMAWSYRAIDAKVWMLDLGRSFEKLCRKAKGTYIEFRPDVDICLNPFTHIVDINEDIDMLVPAICKMASMSRPLDEVQYKAISAMVIKLFREHGNALTVTALRDAFKAGTIEELGVREDPRIRDLAVMLNPYARGGQYERFFEGRNNIDFGNGFVVIENEELKRRPDLHAVVNILLLHQITGEMYLTRNRRKVLFIDELKQQLGDIGADDPVKAAVVEEAARRARKYGGSLGTATQSADDYYGSAQMEAAFNCSDWVFLLRQKPESIEMLDRKGRLSMDEPKKRLLNSLRTEPGVFSEVYISSPVGEGVARNILDPATHLLFSNKLEDNAPIDELRAQGLSIDDAITELLRRRGHAV